MGVCLFESIWSFESTVRISTVRIVPTPLFFFYLQIPPLDRRTVVLIFAATTSAAPNPRACIYHSAAH